MAVGAGGKLVSILEDNGIGRTEVEGVVAVEVRFTELAASTT